MLYRLELENFYSFRDRQVLDLTVPLTTPSDPERFAPIFEGSKLRCPKVVALFGANGSGKSTVLRAIAFLAWFVQHSFDHSGPALPVERFNDVESANNPIRLAIEFGGIMNIENGVIDETSSEVQISHGLYRYELELVCREGFVGIVNRELLLQKPKGEGRWRRVFARGAGEKLLGSKQFPLAGFAQVSDKVRDNASVVATLCKFNHPTSSLLVGAINKVRGNIFIEKFEPSDPMVFQQMASNPELLAQLNADLQRIDVGIATVESLQTPNGPTLAFKHEGHGGTMPWGLESHGTQSFIRIFPWISLALSSGGIAVLDELDAYIHPLILPEIIRWFYSKERNPIDGQLWTSLHSVSLLEDLAKEEIVLCEKDRQGRSVMFSLTSMRPIHRRDNFYRKYMGGEYGAIPRIG